MFVPETQPRTSLSERVEFYAVTECNGVFPHSQRALLEDKHPQSEVHVIVSRSYRLLTFYAPVQRRYVKFTALTWLALRGMRTV